MVGLQFMIYSHMSITLSIIDFVIISKFLLALTLLCTFLKGKHPKRSFISFLCQDNFGTIWREGLNCHLNGLESANHCSALFLDLARKFGHLKRPDGDLNPGSSVYETDALPLGHRATGAHYIYRLIRKYQYITETG